MKSLDIDPRSVGPGPVVHPEVAPFWSNVAAGRLCLQVCGTCGIVRYPTSPICFACLSFDWTLVPISERGLVASAVIVDRATGSPEWAAMVPYISGLIDMDIGVRMPGRILCLCGEGVQRHSVVEAVRVASTTGTSIFAFAHSCIGDAGSPPTPTNELP